MTCDMCCLHGREPVELDYLRSVAKAFGMRRVLPPKGYVMGPDTLPTETWYLRVKHDKPSWNGETHGRAYYSVPRWRWRKDEKSYWKGLRDFENGLERAVKHGYVQPKYLDSALRALEDIRSKVYGSPSDLAAQRSAGG